MLEMRTCFAGLESVICSWLASPPELRLSRKVLIDVTCLGVRWVTTKCWISLSDMKRSSADTAQTVTPSECKQKQSSL